MNFLPELYDLIYGEHYELTDQYYKTNRVHKLGEYAIHSLSLHYKYTILPHIIARGALYDCRFKTLDLLRKLRVEFFFKNENFITTFNEVCEIFNVLQFYLNSFS